MGRVECKHKARLGPNTAWTCLMPWLTKTRIASPSNPIMLEMSHSRSKVTMTSKLLLIVGLFIANSLVLRARHPKLVHALIREQIWTCRSRPNTAEVLNSLNHRASISQREIPSLETAGKLAWSLKMFSDRIQISTRTGKGAISLSLRQLNIRPTKME